MIINILSKLGEENVFVLYIHVCHKLANLHCWEEANGSWLIFTLSKMNPHMFGKFPYEDMEPRNNSVLLNLVCVCVFICVNVHECNCDHGYACCTSWYRNCLYKVAIVYALLACDVKGSF